MCLFYNGKAGRGGDGAHKSLHTPVFKVIVSVDRFFGIVLVVLEIELKHGSVDTAGGVDFLNGHFGSIFNSLSVNGSTAGNRSDTADFDGVGLGFFAVAATGKASCYKSSRKHKCKYF